MQEEFRLSAYSYALPDSLIAQEPVSPRDSSRLLVISRRDKTFREAAFRDLGNFFEAGDVLVLNDTRVIKAKLTGRRISGAQIEILLVKQREEKVWEVLANPAKRVKPNDTLIFAAGAIKAKVLEKTAGGMVVLEFSHPAAALLQKAGQAPLPHYIKKEINDFNQYQTIYAKKEGAIAAPTAGLHFTEALLSEIKKKGISVVNITLHCGLATFRPVKSQDIRQHKMESEWIEVPEAAQQAVNLAKKQGARVIAVGTTSLRVLESVAFCNNDKRNFIKAFSGETNLYITPGYKFKIVDTVLTNFHTPCSTNLILAASFCGLGLIRSAYGYAIGEKFRFYSFGDATLIL